MKHRAINVRLTESDLGSLFHLTMSAAEQLSRDSPSGEFMDGYYRKIANKIGAALLALQKREVA